MLAELIRVLCSRLSLPLPDSDAGGYTLAFPDGYAVRIQGTRDQLLLSGKVCSLPEEPGARDALCRELLALSLGRAARECKATLPRLALHGGDVTLQERHPAGLSPDAFEAAVETFLNLLEKWTTLAAKERQHQAFASGGAAAGIIMP